MTEPTAPHAPPTRLTRSTSDRMVTGVCGGLANYTGLDPVLFRVVFVVATILGGAGLAAYIVASIAIPADDEAESHVQSWYRRRDGAGRVALIAVALFAVFVLANVFDGSDHHWGGGFGLVVLLGVGLWLWTRHRELPTAPTAPTTATSPPPPPPMADTVPGAMPLPPEPPPVPRRRREGSRLFGLTFSVLLLTSGVLAALEASNAADVSAAVAFAVLLVVVGCGLLVGTWFGRSRGLIAIGVLLTVITASASVVDVPFRGGTGDREWRPQTVDTLEREYRLGAGRLDLDLRLLDLNGRARHVEVYLGTGKARVWLPPEAHVELDTHVGIGSAEVLGREYSGIDVDRTLDVNPSGSHRIVIQIEVGVGRLEVLR